jgi:hypothetical protein
MKDDRQAKNSQKLQNLFGPAKDDYSIAEKRVGLLPEGIFGVANGQFSR